MSGVRILSRTLVNLKTISVFRFFVVLNYTYDIIIFMITKKIAKKDRKDFYQSKFEYFKKVSGLCAILIGLLEISYFSSDCLLYGRFAYETLIPRLSVLIPLGIFCFFYPKVNDYRLGALLYYLMPHAAMWCTIWSVYHLENRDFAREGFIIMHFAFLAIGLSAPLKYHLFYHGLLIVDIVISNRFNHYEYFTQMIGLAVPLMIGVCLMMYILESSYADHYQMKKQLELSSKSDKLTGAYNRYILNDIVDEQNHLILGDDVYLLMLDIDFFKNVNDTYGHEAGDQILKLVAMEMKSRVYGSDYVIRWGGEEFVVLLNGYSASHARDVAEKMRVAVSKMENVYCPITISIGLCKYDKNDTYHELVRKADVSLYYAKNHGRNQVVDYKNIGNDTQLVYE